jgi:hypothetical protein
VDETWEVERFGASGLRPTRDAGAYRLRIRPYRQHDDRNRVGGAPERRRAMLEAMLDGITDPATLAVLAQAKLRAKHAQLEQALSGLVTAHHRFLLSELLSQIDYLDEAITRVSEAIAERRREEETIVTSLCWTPFRV